MPSIDYAARRALVTAAIEKLLTDQIQSYTYDGNTFTKLDLGDLQKEERRLLAMERRQSRRRGAFHRAAPR